MGVRDEKALHGFNYCHARCIEFNILFLVFISILAPTLFAQYREIPLPFPDTTRFKVQFLDDMHGWLTQLAPRIS